MVHVHLCSCMHARHKTHPFTHQDLISRLGRRSWTLKNITTNNSPWQILARQVHKDSMREKLNWLQHSIAGGEGAYKVISLHFSWQASGVGGKSYLVYTSSLASQLDTWPRQPCCSKAKSKNRICTINCIKGNQNNTKHCISSEILQNISSGWGGWVGRKTSLWPWSEDLIILTCC